MNRRKARWKELKKFKDTTGLAAGLPEDQPNKPRGIETTATDASSDHEGSSKAETKGGSCAKGLHARQPAGDSENDYPGSPSAQERRVDYRIQRFRERRRAKVDAKAAAQSASKSKADRESSCSRSHG